MFVSVRARYLLHVCGQSWVNNISRTQIKLVWLGSTRTPDYLQKDVFFQSPQNYCNLKQLWICAFQNGSKWRARTSKFFTLQMLLKLASRLLHQLDTSGFGVFPPLFFLHANLLFDHMEGTSTVIFLLLHTFSNQLQVYTWQGHSRTFII